MTFEIDNNVNMRSSLYMYIAHFHSIWQYNYSNLYSVEQMQYAVSVAVCMWVELVVPDILLIPHIC